MANGSGAAPATAKRTPSQDYVIRGGQEGKRRLELLGRTMWPTTFQLLKRNGIAGPITVLDIGCGGGDVTLAIARMVGPEGRVVGIDLDGVKIEAARREAQRQGLGNIEFRVADVNAWSEECVYDRIYARFLLTHLPDCSLILARLRQALRPGGVLIVEDIDFTGSFCYPPSAAYQRYVELYRGVVARRGADADIGPKLYGLLTEACFYPVQLFLVQPCHTHQEEKELSLSTLRNISQAVLDEGLIDPAELERVIGELEQFTIDPTTVIGLPRVFQACGQRLG